MINFLIWKKKKKRLLKTGLELQRPPLLPTMIYTFWSLLVLGIVFQDTTWGNFKLSEKGYIEVNTLNL